MPEGRKLLFEPLEPPFHVVLVEPEIPPNTGAISRTCVATDTILHLVEPLGFRIDDKAVRRAGLDYWPHLKLHVHKSWRAFREAFPNLRLHAFTANTEHSYLNASFQPGDALVFGKESVGLPDEILDLPDVKRWGIPTSGHVRSLNLSNAVSIVLYQALAQSGALEKIVR